LTEEQYRQVCEACDRVLRMPGSTLERISIPWLHVLREHSFVLKYYEGLVVPSTTLGSVAKVCATKARSCAGWLRQLWQALWSDGEPWRASQELLAPVDVLLVSHLLNEADAGKADDFYFGSLPELLRAEGLRVVVALIDHTGTPDVLRVRRWDGAISPRVLLSSMLDFQSEVSLYRRLRKESSRLASLSRQEPPGLLKKVFARASLEAMSGAARATLRLSEQIARLTSAIDPKIIIVTYEGHSWERVAFSAAREASAGLECVGYQHAAIFRLQHGALRKLGRSFDADLILTAGSVSKGQIEGTMRAQGIPVRVLGSSRAILSPKSCEADQSPKSDDGNSRAAAITGVTCLVLPEGVISECLLLFEFSLSCAELMPDLRFIWRLHPLITPANIMKANPRMRTLPANIEFSEMGLEADYRRAHYALYRGSTAIVPGEMGIDPLYELDALKVKVVRPDEFRAVIRGENKTVLNTITDQNTVTRYCDAFYSPIDPKVILSMLSRPAGYPSSCPSQPQHASMQP
jgi:hypothetical protein